MISFFNSVKIYRFAMLGALSGAMCAASCGRSHDDAGPVIVETRPGRVCQLTGGLPRMVFGVPLEDVCLVGHMTMDGSGRSTVVVEGLEWRTQGLAMGDIAATQADCAEWWGLAHESGVFDVPSPPEDVVLSGILTANLVGDEQFVVVGGEVQLVDEAGARLVRVVDTRLWTGHTCF